MRPPFSVCKQLVLAMFASAVPIALAGATLDDTAAAAELSRMGCEVHVRLFAGVLTVERVKMSERLSEDLFIQLRKLGHLSALYVGLPTQQSGSACLRGLISLSTVRELALSGPEINDQVAQYIGTMTNLESLRLHSVSISEGGLLRLANLKALKTFELSNFRTISRRAVEAIATLTNLQEIAIDGKCEKRALLALQPLTELATISLSGTEVDDLLAELRTLPNLRTVKISGAMITPATSQSLLAMPNLESLELDCCSIDPEAAQQLQLLHLKQLDYYGISSKIPGQLLKTLGTDLLELHAR